jgi:hypothetical protein
MATGYNSGMRLYAGIVVLLLAGMSWAAPKAPTTGKASNKSMELDATLYVDREAIQKLVGSDLDGYYVIVDLRLSPKSKLTVSRDDFLLRTDRDGEKATPWEASQIAGPPGLVVSQNGEGGVRSQQRGPVWGGLGGAYPTMGAGAPEVGNSAGPKANKTTAVNNDSNDAKKVDPVFEALKTKIFPEKETDQPVSGLLYFPMDPKQKAKDLELICTTPSGKLSIRFR